MTENGPATTRELGGTAKDVKHTPLESYAVLGAMLAQVADCQTWDPKLFTQAVIGWDGVVTMALSDEPTAVELASRLQLTATSRTTQRPSPRYEGHNTAHLDHVVMWTGSHAGHQVKLTAFWQSPLGDVDAAEGEFLA
jgi:hypothetical protein